MGATPKTRGAIVALIVMGLAPAPLAAMAQTAPAAQPDYHPSLGDLMTMAVQPRHAKLGLGGKARDWAYVAYEASELRNAFNRIARTIPTYRNSDLATLFGSTVKDPLDQIDAAIKAKDGPGFDKAYANITHACNACHQSQEHSFVVIRAPLASAYPNQVFSAR